MGLTMELHGLNLFLECRIEGVILQSYDQYLSYSS